jgi:hypothetical protein
VATRAAQETRILNAAAALAFVARHGVICEAARRGEIPSLADAIAGEALRGNWWSHPRGREIFAITRALREAPQVLVCRLVDAKITYVHERLWPALVRAADRFAADRLARVREVHSAGGKHVLEETAFPQWVPAAVAAAAKRLSAAAATKALAALLPLARE